MFQLNPFRKRTGKVKFGNPMIQSLIHKFPTTDIVDITVISKTQAE